MYVLPNSFDTAAAVVTVVCLLLDCSLVDDVVVDIPPPLPIVAVVVAETGDRVGNFLRITFGFNEEVEISVVVVICCLNIGLRRLVIDANVTVAGVVVRIVFAPKFKFESVVFCLLLAVVVLRKFGRNCGRICNF